MASFAATLAQHDLTLRRGEVTTVQINVGKLCNQACHHCHVEAGPKRKEIMARETVSRLLTLLEASPAVHTIDLTGGAPELNPHFRELVVGSRALGKTVIDRCNLTVLFLKGQESTARFLQEQQVEITASLPCYAATNVDRQRGHGVFAKSIKALQLLNALGYGKEPELRLNLVYNPQGATLPPEEAALQTRYKQELRELFGIEFNRLYAITNMPIKRFHTRLQKDGELQAYMDLLLAHFNPWTAAGLMCRSLVSVSWDGRLYDCDFNQMLEIDLEPGRDWDRGRTLWDLSSFADLTAASIATADHCFGCTAGSGSSCGGALNPSVGA